MVTRVTLVCLFVMVGVIAQAQSTFLPLELQLRGGASFFPEGSGNYFAPTIAMDLLTNPGRNIGFGLNVNAGNGRSNYTVGTNSYTEPARHLYTGVSLRFAKSRIAKFRPFVQFRYGLLQMSTTDATGKPDQFTSAQFGFSTGLMMRIGKRAHLILPEAGFTARSKGLSFETPKDYIFGTPYIPMAWISTGIAWQIGFEK
ncbi:MAG: hypothetical protein ACKOYP_13720 [Bacteroidota bacterium]